MLIPVANIPGYVAALLIVLIMLVSNDRKVLGEIINGRLLNVVGWVTAIVMGVAVLGLVATTIFA